MNHRRSSVDRASDYLRRMVGEASSMVPTAEPAGPRHRGERTAQAEPAPAAGTRFADVAPGHRPAAGPDVVFSPDPGRFPRAADPFGPIHWADDPSPRRSDDHGIGFRSTQEVTAEMSPVIYRPAGSGPERDPRNPARVPISGPEVPTAASFTDEDDFDDDFSRSAPGEAFDDGLDEDPEVSDDELADEAEDARLDDLEAAEHAEGAESEGRDLAAARRPLKQRRRRRILRRQDDPTDDTGPHTDDLGPEPDDLATSPFQDPSHLEDPSPHEDSSTDGDTDTSDDPAHPVPRPRRRRVRTLHLSAPPTGTGADDDTESVESGESVGEQLNDDHERAVADVETPEAAPAQEAASADPHEDEPVTATAAVSGHVLSTRGRGLRGMTVAVLDEDGAVAGTTTTARRGEFTIDGLPAGSYRVGARDPIDGDFAEGWHGASDAARATVLQVDDDSTVRGVEVPLIGRVGIDADVNLRSTKAVIEIDVIDRTTGLPAEGEIVTSTEHFRVALPLEHGHATLTLFGSPHGSGGPAPELAARLRIEYAGSEHSTPANRTVRLR